MTASPQKSWTILEILRWTTDYFRTQGVAEPRASAEVLLAHALGLKRLDLYLRYDQPLTPEELSRFRALVVRRRQGEPVAYLTGHKEFWSLDFQVTPAVLIPRPETEVLVAAALEAAREFEGEDVGKGGQGPVPGGKTPLHEPNEKRKPKTAPTPPLRGLEVGVGSGAVVVALARELPQFSWAALDRSFAALQVAQENARRLGAAAGINFFQGSLLSPLKPGPRFALVVANLPYVPRGQWEELPRDLKDFEPREALLGGEDGLDLIRPLVAQAERYLQPGGWLALEVGEGQAAAVLALLAGTGAYDLWEAVNDYLGIQRVVRARRKV